MNDEKRLKIANDLSVELHKKIHESCKLIEIEPNKVTEYVSNVVLYALSMNLVTFVDQIAVDLDSKIRIIEHHLDLCKKLLYSMHKTQH